LGQRLFSFIGAFDKKAREAIDKALPQAYNLYVTVTQPIFERRANLINEKAN